MQNQTLENYFPKAFTDRVVAYKEILKEVETMTLDETIENFARDTHPERELVIWEAIAELYEEGTKPHPEWDFTAKKEHFKSVLAQSLGING
jgi:hypothetical protein